MSRRRGTSEGKARRAGHRGECAADEGCTKPELWVYRDRTTSLLLRYLHMSIEVGRLPSILGREFFRAHVTSYRVSTFEDAVIFVHDVERSLQQLDTFSQQLIARVVLQEYTREEAARLLGCASKTVSRRLPQALDMLSEIFLARGILREWETSKRQARRPCQESRNGEEDASCCCTAR
jgi:hypothetical protein